MFTNKFDLTFGTDPEYFIVEKDAEQKEWAIPVPHFIENLGIPEVGYDETRKHPVLMKLGEEVKIIMDGVAAEFTVKPAKTPKEMYERIHLGLSALEDFANKFGYTTSVKPTVHYDFFKWYNPNNKALEWCGIFGCDPDEDAILEGYNSPEIDVTTHLYRYAGGHKHLSDNNRLLNKYPRPAIKLMAITNGLYSILSSEFPDLEKLRMFKYGQPGRFRVQNYPNGITGIEYRSPSNLWTSKLETIEGMFYWAEKMYELLSNPEKAINVINEYLSLAVEAIQEVNQEKAKYILSKI